MFESIFPLLRAILRVHGGMVSDGNNTHHMGNSSIHYMDSSIRRYTNSGMKVHPTSKNLPNFHLYGVHLHGANHRGAHPYGVRLDDRRDRR